VATFMAAFTKKDEGVQKVQQPATSSTSRVCRPSPLLVMDDIVEKLKLLECEEEFLRPRGFPILHRCFFAQMVALPGQTTQFEVMYELIRWLLGQASRREAKCQKEASDRKAAADARAGPPCPVAEADAEAGDAAAGRVAASAALGCGSKGDAVVTEILINELVTELAARGIQVSADATLLQLRQGHGEGVCLILNELINQELVALDFHFEQPIWGEGSVGKGAAAEVPAEEIDEEVMDSESEGSPGSPSAGCCGELSADLSEDGEDAAVMERPLDGIAGVSPYERVHECGVDPEAWRIEAERVRPLLRMSADVLGPLAGWQGTVSKTREYCLRVEELCRPPLLPEGMRSCCRQWRHELDELRCHEDRLNILFSERAAEAGRLRTATAPEAEAVATLQTSIANLSEVLSNVTEEMEKKKSEAVGHTEVALDESKLSSLKKAFQRLRDESRQLELRIGCVQNELTGQQLVRTARERHEQGSSERPESHSEDHE